MSCSVYKYVGMYGKYYHINHPLLKGLCCVSFELHGHCFMFVNGSGSFSGLVKAKLIQSLENMIHVFRFKYVLHSVKHHKVLYRDHSIRSDHQNGKNKEVSSYRYSRELPSPNPIFIP